MSEEKEPIVVNAEEATETEHLLKERWGAAFVNLTPSMRPRGGSLGVNRLRVPPGRTACPFHAHEREDEVFYVLSGRGTLRYGNDLIPLRPGDCVSCPAGTKTAHQIANPYDEDLIYLAIGHFDPHEVALYPDSGKVLVRSISRVGWLENVGYMDGEPDSPRVFGLIDDAE